MGRRLQRGLPDSQRLTPQNATIQWQGFSWWVQDGSSNPGPNTWGRFYENVAVQPDGSLVLQVRKVAGTWYCAELSQEGATLGYGRYRFVYDYDAGTFDPNLVLGLFTYDLTAPTPGKRELDIECTRWGSTSDTSRVWYTSQPVTNGDWTQSDHGMSTAAPYTSEFIWQAGQVYFRTVDANGVLMGEHLVNNAVEPTGNEKVALNLWLMNGSAPLNGTGGRVRLLSFHFTPGITYTPLSASSLHYTFDTPYGWALKQGASVSGGQLVLPCVGGYSRAYTGNVVDIGNASLIVEVAGVPQAGNGSTEAIWALRVDANNGLLMFVSGGGFAGRVRQNGVNTDVALGVYTPATQRFWKISMSGSTVTFWYSADGSSWTNGGSASTTLTSLQLSAMKLRFECGYYGSETSPSSFVISGIN